MSFAYCLMVNDYYKMLISIMKFVANFTNLYHSYEPQRLQLKNADVEEALELWIDVFEYTVWLKYCVLGSVQFSTCLAIYQMREQTWSIFSPSLVIFEILYSLSALIQRATSNQNER